MLIYQVFDFLKKELNSYFKNSKTWNEEKVSISGLSDKGASNGDSATNGLSLTLINITQESVMKNYNPASRSGNSFSRKSQPQTFYIDFLVSANNTQYEESLKILSEAILFFQSNSNFDHTNTPTMLEGVNKLSISIVDLSYHELSNIWGMLGSTHLPAILYRCRVVTFDADQVKEFTPSVSSGRLSDN